MQTSHWMVFVWALMATPLFAELKGPSKIDVITDGFFDPKKSSDSEQTSNYSNTTRESNIEKCAIGNERGSAQFKKCYEQQMKNESEVLKAGKQVVEEKLKVPVPKTPPAEARKQVPAFEEDED
jgi:hypothetical protein